VLETYHKQGILQLENLKGNLVELPTEIWTEIESRLSAKGHWLKSFFDAGTGIFYQSIIISSRD
jgi:hypothetical protein